LLIQYTEDKGIFVLSKQEKDFPFEGEIEKVFYSEENDLLRKWWIICHSKESKLDWYFRFRGFIKSMGKDYDPIEMHFFDFLKRSYRVRGLKFPDFSDQNYILGLESKYKTYLTKAGNSITSIHPPDMNLVIKSGGDEVTASTFRKTAILESVIAQNNYTNLSLQSIGEQLNRIEKDNTNISSTTSVPFSSYSSGEKINLSKQPKVDSSSSEVIQKIYDKLQELKVKHDLNPLSQDLSRENFSDEDSDKEPTTDELITQLENLTIDEDTFPSINRISNNRKVQFKSKKPYYPRPSPVDLLHEEDLPLNQQFDGSSIYEWNLDGFSEYQIYKLVHHMLMAATAYSANDNKDTVITDMLISGFTGQLKGWWDNYLTPEAKYAITHAVKTSPNQSEPVPDTVNTLLYTIIVHFTGKNNLYVDKIQEQLINKMSNFIPF